MWREDGSISSAAGTPARVLLGKQERDLCEV